MQLLQTRIFQPLLITLGALALALPARTQIQAAPTVINMDFRATIDTAGDGELKIHFKMNAQQWQNWKQQYGSNPSLFKRDMSKFFSMYELTDFQLKQDDMNRQAEVTILGKGMATYEGDGIFELELEKKMTGGEIVDGEYRVTYTEPQGPTVLTLVDQRMKLPKGASNVEVTTGKTGDQVLRYRLDVEKAGLPWNWVALGFGLVGAACLLLASRTSNGQGIPTGV